METGRLGPNTALYWLLMEPILKGAHLGTSWEEVLMMSGTLINKVITTVQHLRELAGTHMDDAVTLARRLEVRSVRVVGLMLEKFRKELSDEDRALLAEWFPGQITPDVSYFSPRLCIRPQLTDCEKLGVLLEVDSQVWMPMDSEWVCQGPEQGKT